MPGRELLLGLIVAISANGIARGQGLLSSEAEVAVQYRLVAQAMTVGDGGFGESAREVAPLCPGQGPRLTHMAGTVVLRALVGKDGAIESLRVLSGPEPLRGSATKAVAQWRYKPFIVDGQARETYKTIEVEFDMNR